MADEPLTHLSRSGEVRMVDVGDKDVTDREAVAEATVRMSAETRRRLFGGDLPKGDALPAVRLAGIAASKQTPFLLPLCHPLPITGVEVDVEETDDGAHILARVRTSARTGVEMEAMTAVTVAALALYDMVKAVERGVRIEQVGLVRKSGGRSGTWEKDKSEEDA